MRIRTAAAVLALFLGFAAAARPDDPPPTGTFSGVAEIDNGQGNRSVGFSIVISRPLSRAEALPFRTALEQGGQQALLAVLKNNASGNFKFGALEYTVNLIVAEKTTQGYRYLIVTARNFRYEEVNEGKDSLDFPFAVIVFDMPEFGRGDGTVYSPAALSIDAGGGVHATGYNDKPGRLKNVERKK